jgi:hypothetical protein
VKCQEDYDEVNENLLHRSFKKFQDRNQHLKIGGTKKHLDTDAFKIPSFRSYTLLPAFIQLKMAVFWVVALCSLVDIYQTTQHYNPDDSHLCTHHRENFKSYLFIQLFETFMQTIMHYLMQQNLQSNLKFHFMPEVTTLQLLLHPWKDVRMNE